MVKVTQSHNSSIGATSKQFILLVGCVVYVIIWFMRNIVVNLLNDVVADNYIHPKSYKRSSYWGSIFARKMFFWISAVILLFFIISGSKLIIYLADSAYSNISHFKFSHNFFNLLVIELATTGLIYAMILTTHVVINSWRLISRDL
jgi:hypothetical protein